MNDELQWRNQMRKLGGPVEPERDLWPQIAQRTHALPARRSALPRLRYALAASVMLVCGATAIFVAQRTIQQENSPLVSQPQMPLAGDLTQGTAVPPAALDWALPANPALAAAAQDLDGASVDLQQALEQQPDAVFLVELLNRTNGQRMHLLQESPYSG
jgi:hypothetical protein